MLFNFIDLCNVYFFNVGNDIIVDNIIKVNIVKLLGIYNVKY